MPKVCVFGQCDNRSDYDKGITLFAFPKDPKLRKKWTKCVLESRKDLTEPPIDASHITVCSEHFTPDTRRSPKTTRYVIAIVV